MPSAKAAACTLMIALVAIACTRTTGVGGAGSAEGAAPPGTATPLARSNLPDQHRETGNLSPNGCGHVIPPGSPNPNVTDGCKRDEDCKDKKGGRCVGKGGGHSARYNTCIYREDQCFVDADCKAKGSQVCDCDNETGHRCVGGNCATDADCGAGGYCSASPNGACWNETRGTTGYFCRTKADTCTSREDCRDPNRPNERHDCMYKKELGHWACVVLPTCPVG